MRVVDHDHKETSRALTDALTALGYFRIVGRYDQPADLARALDHGTAVVGVQIPVGFADDLVAGRGPRVQVLLDGTINAAATRLLHAAQKESKEQSR